MRRYALWVSCLLAFFAATLLALPALAAPIKLGETAPDFKLASTMGGEIKLSDYRNKKLVLIEFYHADFGPT